MIEARRGVVIVGAGLIGRKRAAGLDEHRQKLLCVVDPDSTAGQPLAATYGVPYASSLVSALAGVPQCSLVVICATHNKLAELTQQALDHGCHVLVEKPAARTASEFRAAIRGADPAGLKVFVGYNHRFHLAIRRLRDEVASERYGPVLLVRGRYGHGGRPGYENEWRANREVSGGGELLDQGSHLLDLTRFLSSSDLFQVNVSLDSLFWPMAVEDNAFISAKLGSGGRAWLHASWTEWRNQFSIEVFCHTAKLEVTGLGGSYGPERFVCSEMLEGFGPPRVTTVQYEPGDPSWALEMAAVEDSLAGGHSGVADAQDALAVLEIVERAYKGDHH